jgi:hypothetical protein
VIATIWDLLLLLLVAEFVMAPINLWTGWTLPAFTAFTGSPPPPLGASSPLSNWPAPSWSRSAWRCARAGIAGAAAMTAVCAVYLIRLLAPQRRSTAGLAGFLLFGACAAALPATQIAHTR